VPQLREEQRAAGRTCAAKLSMAWASRLRNIAEALAAGIGSSGSMWMRLSMAGVDGANVSISGPSARSGARARAPASASPA
jgi:hypothetical protein